MPHSTIWSHQSSPIQMGGHFQKLGSLRGSIYSEVHWKSTVKELKSITCLPTRPHTVLYIINTIQPTDYMMRFSFGNPTCWICCGIIEPYLGYVSLNLNYAGQWSHGLQIDCYNFHGVFILLLLDQLPAQNLTPAAWSSAQIYHTRHSRKQTEVIIQL